MNTPYVDACAVINSLPKVKFSRLELLYQTPKKWKLAFQKYKLSNSFFKMQLQNCVFPNLNLQILSSKSNLCSSFANLFNFKFLNTCWKSSKLCKTSLTHLEKRSLARWFQRFFFWNKRFFFDMQDEANTNAKSFPIYQILTFEVW